MRCGKSNDVIEVSIEDLIEEGERVKPYAFIDPLQMTHYSQALGYYVSDNGEVYTVLKGKIRKQKHRKHSNGYLRTGIRAKDFYIHRLVAELFCENPNNYVEVNHIDGNKENNHYTNLEWCTRSENNKHMFAKGLRTPEEMSRISKMRKPNRVFSRDTILEIRKMSREGYTDREISKIYGTSRGNIYLIKKYKIYREIE